MTLVGTDEYGPQKLATIIANEIEIFILQKKFILKALAPDEMITPLKLLLLIIGWKWPIWISFLHLELNNFHFIINNSPSPHRNVNYEFFLRKEWCKNRSNLNPIMFVRGVVFILIVNRGNIEYNIHRLLVHL